MLEQGQLQFGPYLSLPPGRYEAIVLCDKPDLLDIRVTSCAGQKTIPSEKFPPSADGLRLAFALDQKEDNVEIVSGNVGFVTVTISGLEIWPVEAQP